MMCQGALGLYIICMVLFLLDSTIPVQSLDTACSHVTDKNTTVTVTQILYDHKFYIKLALAAKYEYQSDLEDASTPLFSSTASAVEDEIKSHIMASKGDPEILYDVVVVQFHPISSYSSATATNIPADITVVVDVIVSASQDNVGAAILETTLQQAATQPDGSLLFHVLTVPGNVDVCLREVMHTPQGTLTWVVTDADSSTGTVEKCPVGFEQAGKLPISTRSCIRDSAGHAAWAQFVCNDCGSITQEGEILQLSEEITRSTDESPNLNVISEAIRLFRATEERSGVSILAVAEILEALAQTGSISTEVLNEATTLLSLALDVDAAIIAEAETLYFSSSRINRAVKKILSITQLNEQHNHTTSSSNVILGIQKPAETSFNWFGMRVYVENQNGGNIGGESRFEYYERPTLIYDEESTASIYFQFAELPTTSSSNDSMDVFLTYILHQSNKLFQTEADPTPSGTRRLTANGWVMSVNVIGVGGQTPGTITTATRQTDQTVIDPECGSWNTTLNGGHGSWIQDGCQLAEILENGLAVCQCESKGTVALLKDVTAEPREYPGLNPIVVFGAVVAFIGALFCFLVLILIKKLHKRQLYRMEAAFCFPAAIFYLIFAAGHSTPFMTTGCIVLAVFLHFFMLVTACSMISVAGKFYDTSRRKAVTSKWFAFNMLVPAWGVPVVIITLTVAPNPQVYQNSIPRCFLSADNPYALVFALLLPMIACLVATEAIFFLTNRNVVKQNHKDNATSNQSDAKSPWAWLTTGRIVQITILFILCYITWLFALSIAYSLVTGLQYAFGIFAITQGIAFPVILCLLDTDVKLAVMAIFGKGEQSTRKFQPYFSASQWHPNPDIVPENAPKQFLDDTQQNSTLTRQSFNPTEIPISETEQRRIEDGGHVNPVSEEHGEEIPMSDLKTKEVNHSKKQRDTILGYIGEAEHQSNSESEKNGVQNGHVTTAMVEVHVEKQEEDQL